MATAAPIVLPVEASAQAAATRVLRVAVWVAAALLRQRAVVVAWAVAEAPVAPGRVVPVPAPEAVVPEEVGISSNIC